MPAAAYRLLRGVLPVALVLLVSTGCTPDDPVPTPTTTGGSQSPTPADPRPVTADVTLDAEKVPLEVGPVAVTGDLGVLRIAGPKDASLSTTLWEAFVSAHPGANGVRLVDLEQGTVTMPARTTNDTAIASWTLSPGGPATKAAATAAGPDTDVLYVAFKAPTTPAVDVLLPGGGGLVRHVPVADARDVGKLTVPVSEVTGDAVATTPVAPLDSYTEQAGGQVRTRSTSRTVTVAIGSDVLFASDSADLGPDADAALALAAQQVGAYDGGSLAVVGHTDDVADDAYNQALSERRAHAVADRLATLADLKAFTVSVEGRGESEPAAPGTTPEARAVNRRVELVLTTKDDDEPAEPVAKEAGALPETTGPTASGAASVSFDSGNGVPVDVRVREVQRVGRYLVGSLEVDNTGDREASGGLFSTGIWDPRGAFDSSLLYAATNVTLLRGGLRLYPIDYVSGEDRRDPLADRLVRGLKPGQSTRVTVVWPDPGGDTVVVDAPTRAHKINDAITVGLAAPAFRITDVPVTEDTGRD